MFRHLRVFGTNENVILVMLGDTEEAVRLVAFFRTWHLEAQLLGSRHCAEAKRYGVNCMVALLLSTVFKQQHGCGGSPYISSYLQQNFQYRVYEGEQIFGLTIQIEWCDLPHKLMMKPDLDYLIAGLEI